ncbi:MAG: hypothetical protein J0L64_01910 [Acidobacteria bacterium]|nr:hypothetical protein [Acidobacteriota bacterium]
MNKTLLALVTATAGLLCAQTTADVTPAKPRTMMWEQKMEMAGAPQEATIGFLAAEGAAGFAGAPVKGAPYSAAIENTFTQTLADGTRIQRKSTSQTARDSEGRTRTENTPAVAGSLNVDLPATVFIFDPVAKQTIVLNEKEKTARVMKMPDIGMAKSGAVFSTVDDHVVTGGSVRMRRPAPAGAAVTTSPKEDVIVERVFSVTSTQAGAGPALVTENIRPALPTIPAGGISTNHRVMIFDRGDDGSMKTESLGAQTISGVPCNAKRNIHTIAAGQIGNDRPIEIVNETCFSDQLKTLLSSRTNDPLHGETLMRLTTITRAEPAKSLFEIPPGYTVKEGPQPMIFERRIEKK